MSRKYVIITHKSCRDGFAAAWCAHKYFSEHDLENFVLHVYVNPSEHEETYDALKEIVDIHLKETEFKVLSFDVGYTPELYLRIKELFGNMEIYDHHIGCYDNFLKHYKSKENLPKEFHFDNNKSGAMLAWNYFFPMQEAPELIKYIEDRDLWRYAFSESREFSEGFSVNNTFEEWDKFMEAEEVNIEQTKYIGKILLERRKIIFNGIKNLGDVIELDNLKVFVVNCNTYISDLCEYIYNAKGDDGESICDYVLAWRYCMRARKYYVSLRSSKKSGIDVSEIAKKFNGNGHRNSSGFMCKNLFEEVLKINTKG